MRNALSAIGTTLKCTQVQDLQLLWEAERVTERRRLGGGVLGVAK